MVAAGIDDLLGSGSEKHEEKDGLEMTVNPAELSVMGTGSEGPTIYADMIRGAYTSDTVVKFNLFENRMDFSDGDLKIKHVVTVVLPMDQLRAWADFFERLATNAGLPKQSEAGETPDG